MRRFGITSLALVLLASLGLVLIAGCAQERPSKRPPIHLQQNMDDQPRYNPQAESPFFDNNATMRLPVEGTVARGSLREDGAYFFGLSAQGELVETSPVATTMSTLERGRDRYDIFCAPCHGLTGDGNGSIIVRGMLKPPSFHEQRLVDTADGHIYDVIANGIRNMPAYKYQISVEDRWAIVAYFRALQASQRAKLEDLPADEQQRLNSQ
ncbi:c-type cytochrome [candidate division GN15 bacterium]|nr:c-type cytochrome [candidate division GN15 bacterium]